MSKVFAHKEVAILIDLRQLIDDGRFQEAMDIISGLDETRFAGNGKVDFARFLSLKGMAFFHLSNYNLALETAKQALELVKGTDDNGLIAELQSTIARSYTEIGKISEAKREYRDLISTYRRLDDTVGIIRSLNRLSRIYFIRGQFDKAVDHLLEAADYAQRASDKKWQAMIQGNLGTIFNLTGEFRKAAEFLEESVILNRPLENQVNLCRAYLSLAFAQMHLKNFKASDQNLSLAGAIIEAHGYESERQTLNQYRAVSFLLMNQPGKALAYAQQALELATVSAARGYSTCQSARLVAEAQLRLGNYAAALETAKQALDLAIEIGENIEIGSCQRVIAQIQNALGSHELSERNFVEAVNHLSQCGARFELAQTYLGWSHATADVAVKTEYRREAVTLLSVLNLGHIYLEKPPARKTDGESGILLVGTSPEFVTLVRQATVCADSDIPVLLLGETGTGKDQFAKYVHRHSDRAKGAFIQVNCAAIPVELAESEFFGYQKGAFTNASESKIGLIEAADRGTLFLNEIGDLPLRLQAKLLAALEEKRFYKLGATTPCKVDFRLIAATNLDLTHAVREGNFRADLFYRLAVMTLQMPRLASRGSDAYLLFEHFMALEQLPLADVDAQVLNHVEAACRTYDWPGNVRELKNYVELFTLTERRDPEGVCRRLIAKLETIGVRSIEAERINLHEEVEQFERSRIDMALDNCGGVIRRAAAHLGLPEATLRSKLKKYRISAA